MVDSQERQRLAGINALTRQGFGAGLQLARAHEHVDVQEEASKPSGRRRCTHDLTQRPEADQGSKSGGRSSSSGQLRAHSR